MAELEGKAALVTGAQQGIGAAIAVALAEAGADIAINYQNEATAKPVAAKVEAAGRKAVLVPGDVSDMAAPAAMVKATVDAFGGIDILINNAGVFPRHTMLEATEADWDLIHNVNLKGTFFCSQAAARAMIERGQGGVIISIASVASMGDTPRGVPYAASKGGVISLTRAMALELAEHGIRVNAIAPGLVDTAQPRDGHSEAELAQMGAAMPIGRIGQPEDIANVAVFLASPKSDFMLGQIVHANGGSYLPS
ncbi:MAG: glucose 1-dehydrogenase [Alphaproteobacteria bacterium]